MHATQGIPERIAVDTAKSEIQKKRCQEKLDA